MRILENDKPDNFYLGKNVPSVARLWKAAQDAANQIAKSKLGRNTITWSSAIDWNGFPKDLSYAKTLEGQIINVSKARKEDWVEVSFNGKHSYMTKEQFKKHKLVIKPFLTKVNDFGFGDPYWKC